MTRHLSRLTAALCVTALATACTERHAKQGDIVEERTPLCQGSASPAALRQVATEAGDAQLGPCGQLAYLTDGSDDRTLWLHGPELQAPAKVADGVARFAFAPSGTRLLYLLEAALVERDLADGTERRVDAHSGARFGFLDAVADDRERVWLCSDERLSIADGALDSLREIANAVDCKTIESAANGSRLVYVDQSRAVHTVASDGSAAPVPHGDIALDDGQVFADDGWANDLLRLSGDGQVLLHRQSWFETCGDTVCGKTGTVQLFDLAHGERIGEVPSPVNDCCGHDDFDLRLPATGHTLAFSSTTDGAWVLDANLQLEQMAERLPLYVFRDQRRALLGRYADKRRPVVELWELDGRSVLDHNDGALLETVVVSAGESQIAVASRPTSCSGSTPCDRKTELRVWNGKQSRVLATASDDIRPLWVGDDGSVLVRGYLPQAAVGSDGHQPGLHLIDPQGTLLASLADADPGPWTYRSSGDGGPVWVAGRTLLVRLTASSLEQQPQQLYAIDLDSGAQKKIAEASAIVVRLDHAGQRLAYRLDRGKGASRSSELWAGALPKP